MNKNKAADVDGALRKLGAAVATGVLGVVLVDGAKRIAASGALRRGAVSATALGLRGARSAETGAESARLLVSDVVAEAREQIGEQAPPPGNGDAGHGHEH
ncbi:DUF1490 family protein [Tsukamurella soli]|uniref:DUF1490 family protein n=1 Tax=Tsukamurella soli TaxID=644556 RepID=A0ABP8JFK0_9ACTN